ncbi:hypothetical protein PVK06_018329 [Gossypium arboreum]|uniref:Uncharacterized protein n=1 Tax=Gossypium arboreum TaxID=29729 RepID=A0ABR0Q5I3_GOSAR|nr:hypothetical protein PVK06_018329 [Gossypium arboreum]
MGGDDNQTKVNFLSLEMKNQAILNHDENPRTSVSEEHRSPNQIDKVHSSSE